MVKIATLARYFPAVKFIFDQGGNALCECCHTPRWETTQADSAIRECRSLRTALVDETTGKSNPRAASRAAKTETGSRSLRIRPSSCRSRREHSKLPPKCTVAIMAMVMTSASETSTRQSSVCPLALKKSSIKQSICRSAIAHWVVLFCEIVWRQNSKRGHFLFQISNPIIGNLGYLIT